MMFTHLYRQSISCVLSSVLLASQLSADGIVVDTAAAVKYRPMMESTANAIPLINIVTPNSTGLSHNKFSEFNIEQRGVIFNNATSAVQTQLGGWVQGNANLGTTPARVILNEVTGTNRSLLRGYGEVAGHSADLIIANPNGITVNGGGFINTSRATLTTGNAQLNGDTLAGFHVQRGDILIEESGLNTSNIDRVELYTKALVLNAQIHAKKLDMVTGENTITRDGTITSDNVIGSEEFSIDSSALGGIYADTIRLVGTDRGVGVNLPQITYASNSLELTVDGKIILGTAIAENTLRTKSASLTVNDKMYSSDIGIIATETMTNNGAVIADTLNITGGDVTNNGGMIGGNQLSIHAETITNNEVLYSANAIDLSASNTLRNTEGSIIRSAGSINIHDTGTLSNESATIQADGNIVIQSTALENISNITPTIITNHVSRYVESMIGVIFNSNTLYAEKWLDTINRTGYVPSYILAGGDMSINAAIHNRYSMIAANGDLYLSGSVNNEASIDAHDVVETQYYYDRQHQECHMDGCHWHNNSYWGALTHTDTITDQVYSTIQAGGSIYGNLISINNADVIEGSAPTNTSSQGIPASSHFSDISVGSQYTLPSGNYSQYVTVTNPALPYLIESNPLYADYNTFISSDYIMSRLHLDTAANTKRLGDARYETQLVRDAVFRLTGERYLAGFGSDTAQYQALMDNAFTVSSDLNLELGVKLSASQVAALNKDIVWMEEREVSGQRVLVPVVYLASLKNQELTSGGKIIAGGDIQFAVSDSINNAGEIRAGRTLLAQADTITNTGGAIKSTGDMLLHATNDITNTSGTISGNNVALVSDNGAIVSQSMVKTIDLKNNTTTGSLSLIGERASIQSSGDMLLSAKKDIALIGSETSAGGNIEIEGENVTLASAEQNSRYTSRQSSSGTSEYAITQQNGSVLNATGDIAVNAVNDITVNSSNIDGKNIALSAGNNIAITASNDSVYSDIKNSSKHTFSASSSRDMNLKESVVSSSINGNNIAITSGKDTTLQAANLKATENIQVDAAGDINILAQAYREASLHQESKSSFGGLVSSASLDSTDAIKLREATVKTEAKNIIMNSGKDITVVASEINAAADVQLKAFENLNIIAGEEIKSEKHESQKSSFNPLGLLSLVGIDAGPIYTQEIHNKDNYDTTAKSSTIKAGGSITADTGTTNIIGSNLDASGDVTIKADIGGINIASAQELHNASTLDKKVEVKLTDIFTASADAFTNAHKMDDTKLKFNVASATFDESTTSAQAVKNVGSSITSGKNVTLDSSDDIAIKGSDITARDTIDLKSKTGNISITESVDTTNTQSSEKHASAEVNLVVQNEFVEAGVAVKNAVEAAEQLKQTKEDYSNYKRELKKLEASLETLKTDPQVSENDIANLQALIAMTKDDEAYYIAAIAAATVNLASKSVAVAQQANAAGASTATAGFSAGLSLDIQGSKTSTDTTATKSNASNLTASNINITTDKTTDTSVTASGSNVNAADTLNIDTHDLNVIASKDTSSSNSNSKDISGSVSMTVYGAASGPQVSLGYGQNESRSNSTTYTNSTLTGNTVNLDATNDATFKGATVRADDTLNVNVGNNLEVASVQDTSSSSNHGMNISGGFGMGSDSTYANNQVGVRTGNGKVESVNGGIGASNGRSFDTQTVLTSLTGDSVNITTGKDTKLSGAVIAATDANGNDTGKLNLSTNTLTTENLTDTHYNSATGFSIGANIGLTPETKDPKPDTQNKENKTTTTINSPRLAFNTSRDVSVGKTLATVGEGNIAITDTENSSDTTNLNRDVTKVDKELYSSSTGTKVDATLDTRLLTEEGRAQIKEDYEKTKRLGETAYETATEKSVSLIGDQADGQSNFADRLQSKETLAQVAQIIASPENKANLELYTNPNATEEERRNAYQAMSNLITITSGVPEAQVKLILSGEDKGIHNPGNNTTYLAINSNKTMGDLANTIANEASGAIDTARDAGIKTTENYAQNREDYSTLMGDDFQRYLNNAMENSGQQSLDTIANTRYGTTDYTTTLQANTLEYEALDPAMVFHRYADPRLNVALGEGLPENHFINRFQSDTAKGFAGLENGLNRLYNLDTSKMSPVGKAAYEHLMVRAITAPAIAESDLNPMDKSGDMLIEQIKQFLNISKNNEKVDKE